MSIQAPGKLMDLIKIKQDYQLPDNYSTIEENDEYWILNKRLDTQYIGQFPYSNIFLEFGYQPKQKLSFIRRVFYPKSEYTKAKVETKAHQSLGCKYCVIGLDTQPADKIGFKYADAEHKNMDSMFNSALESIKNDFNAVSPERIKSIVDSKGKELGDYLDIQGGLYELFGLLGSLPTNLITAGFTPTMASLTRIFIGGGATIASFIPQIPMPGVRKLLRAYGMQVIAASTAIPQGASMDSDLTRIWNKLERAAKMGPSDVINVIASEWRNPLDQIMSKKMLTIPNVRDISSIEQRTVISPDVGDRKRPINIR